MASGILNDNLSLKGVLRGALSGALTAGLMQGVGDVLQSAGAVTTVGGVSTLSTVGAIAARTTVQGAVQALMGGNFKDGAIAGLAEAAAGHLNVGIDQAVLDKTMTAAEGFAAHNFARIIGSAIRAAANPGDPGQAFASAFLDDVFRQVGPPVAGQPPNPTVDVGGAPIATTPETPVPTVDGQPPAVEGSNLAGNAAPVIPPSDPFSTIRDDAEPTRRELLAGQLGVPVESIVDVGLLDYAGRSTDVLRGFVEGAGFSVLGTGEALIEIAKSPRQFIDGVKTLLTSPEARAQFGNEIVARVKVDLQMLEDAFNSGDMRGTGQQLGKLTTDLAQVAGGVEALARLGVSAGSAGGRLLLGAVDELASSRLLASQGTRVPLGFSGATDFVKFSDSLYGGLARAGFGEVRAGFQGSSVTGRGYQAPNAAFDAGRISDFDIALSSPELMQSVRNLGIELRQQGTRTGPLSPQQIEQLGLTNLNRQLAEQAGRPVNFMIFDSFETAVGRSPTVLVPRKP